VKVRSADEVDTVRNLFREYAAWLAIDLCFQDFETELATLPGSYSPPRGELLLCCVDGEPAGCVALHQWKGDSTTAEMKRLYVREQFRGYGIGRLLLTQVLDFAISQHYQRVRLDTIEDKMPNAIALYERFGFSRIAPYRFNPEPSASYWELDLSRTPANNRP
jgi:ribosomal protein S18 acetylase RimI-like enzyme